MPPCQAGVCVLGLRPDVLHSAGIPLAMEALARLRGARRAWRGQPQPLHNAVRHREHRCHEDQKVQGPFVMPRREQGRHVSGTETRRVQRELPGIDHGGAEGLGHLGRVHILEELRQQPRWEPKGGGKGRVFTLTVVTAM